MATYFDLPEIDDQTTPLGGAVASCMEWCVPDCCGLNAYHVTAENMTKWADTVTSDMVDQARHDVDCVIERLEVGPEIASFYNDSYSRAEVIGWLRKVRDVLEQVRPFARQPTGPIEPLTSQIQVLGTNLETA